MVHDITALVRDTRAEIGKSAFDERVMSVMARVPRHEFIPADQVASAYRNRPLPIGHGQTISLAQRMPFNPLEVLWDPRQPAYLSAPGAFAACSQ